MELTQKGEIFQSLGHQVLPPPKLKVHIFSLQIGGIQPKLVTSDLSIILKKFNHQELQFYQYINSLKINDTSHQIKAFLPSLKGVISSEDLEIVTNDVFENEPDPASKWIDWKRNLLIHKSNISIYLMLQNLAHGMKKPNIIDLKLGQKRLRQNDKNRRQAPHYFLIHGFRVNFNQVQKISQDVHKGNAIFLSKYTFLKLPNTEETFYDYLSLFFFDGIQIRTQILQKTIQKLGILILSIKCLHSWRLASTSICIFYETQSQNQVKIKLVDFQRSYFTGSSEMNAEDTIKGLENLHRFLQQILQKSLKVEGYSKIIEDLALKCLQTQFELAPAYQKVN